MHIIEVPEKKAVVLLVEGVIMTSIIPLAVLETSRAWEDAYEKILFTHLITTSALCLTTMAISTLATFAKRPTLQTAQKIIGGLAPGNGTYIFNLQTIGYLAMLLFTVGTRVL